ncbi:hypothetical protein MTO96_043521, partial [Rhipicephalus appendiculatus]
MAGVLEGGGVRRSPGRRRDCRTAAEHGRGGRASGFHGRVLQLTGTLRLTGVWPLDYEQDDAPPAPMEVVQSMEAAGTRSTSGAREPPAAAAVEAVATPS